MNLVGTLIPLWGSQFGRFGPHPRASTPNCGPGSPKWTYNRTQMARRWSWRGSNGKCQFDVTGTAHHIGNESLAPKTASPTLATCQSNCRSYFPQAFVILRFHTALAVSGHSRGRRDAWQRRRYTISYSSTELNFTVDIAFS